MARRTDPTEARARAVLDQLIDDPAGWSAMLAILATRAVRESLVNIRRVRGMTQAGIAEAMGVKLATVRAFETEPYPDPYVSTLARYARALDMRLDFGIISTEPEPEPADG